MRIFRGGVAKKPDVGRAFWRWVSYHSCGRAPLRLGAVCAGVLLEGLLSNPVKCKRRNGALKPRGGDVPGAVGTAPACESFILNPDHASRHECTSWILFEQALPSGGEGRQLEKWSVESAVRNNFVTISHEIRKRPSNYSASPW